MSLINEALKKAQRQRLEGSAPPVPETPSAPPADSGPRVAKRSKPTDFRSQMLLLIGGGLAFICALAVAGFFLLRSNAPEAPAAPSVPAPATSAAAAPVVKPPEPITLPATTPAAAPPSTPPAASSAASLPAPSPAVNAPTAPATALRSGQEPPPPPERPKPTPRMIAIIEALKVAGIRASGAESKVLMNDRVYRLNDTVEHELNIRLVGVTVNSLTFEDERGATYTRSF
jgi:hypothetical protein